MKPLAGCMLAAALAVPSPVSAQAEVSTRMSVSASQVFDSNIFATPAAIAQSDWVTRVGPAFEARYRSLPVEIVGRYELQAERYAAHPDLTTSTARQDADLTLRVAPRTRLDLLASAGYARTQNPAEFNTESLIGVGRMQASRVLASSTARYDWSNVTTISGEYMFGRDSIIDGMSSDAHRVRVGAQRRTGQRNSYRADYHFRSFNFDASPGETAHVVTAGWVHAVTPRTGFDISVGPRFNRDQVRPEIAVSLRRQLSRGEISVAYASTEQTAIGERGTIDVHRVSVNGRYRPWRRLVVTATPAVARSVRGSQQVPVYSLDVESTASLANRFSLSTWCRIGRQYGTLSGAPGMIPQHRLGLTLTISSHRTDAADRR
jgi:hypothetical protein